MGEVNTFIQSIPLNYFIILSSVLFSLGVLGVLLRKNAIVILGCVELMLNSVNLCWLHFQPTKVTATDNFSFLHYGGGCCGSSGRFGNYCYAL